jgi:hypothetical protein
MADDRSWLIHGDSVLENGPWLWQSNSFYTNYSDFFAFCDFIEVRVVVISIWKLANRQIECRSWRQRNAWRKWGRSREGSKWLCKVDSIIRIWLWAFPGHSIGLQTKKTLTGCTQFGYISNTTLECFDTYNASNLYFADRTVGNGADRQWNWMLCNEVRSFLYQSPNFPASH